MGDHPLRRICAIREQEGAPDWRRTMFPDLITDDAFRLETRRLWLRWPRVADAAAIAKYAGVEAVSRYTANLPHPYRTADAEAFILSCRANNHAGKQVGLAITRKAKPGETIGMVGLHSVSDGGLTIGYWLGEPFWGQGFMGEAVDEMLALGFIATQAPHFRTIVRDGNLASQRLLESRGFECVETLQVNMPARGGIFPCGKYVLDRSDWELRQQERFRARRSASRSRKTGSNVRNGGEPCLCA
jgi:RimJ/RimL family protein N-acetyltransferase